MLKNNNQAMIRRKHKFPAPYIGAKGVVGRPLTFPEIFRLAGVPEKRWGKLEKVYNSITKPYQRQFSRIHGEEVNQELIEMLKKETNGAISSFQKIPPSWLPDLFPKAQGLIIEPQRPMSPGIRKDRIRKKLGTGWKTVSELRRASFRTEGKTDSMVKGSGGIENITWTPEESKEPNLPFKFHPGINGRQAIYGGIDVESLAHDFAATLEIVKALKKHNMWKKFKNKVRIPLSIVVPEEIPYGDRMLPTKKYLEKMFEHHESQLWAEPTTELRKKLNEGMMIGQTHYGGKNMFQRLDIMNIKDFMTAQGFKGSDLRSRTRRIKAMENFTKDLADYTRILHKEKIALRDINYTSMAAKDIGPNMEVQDFDTVQVEKWGERKNINYNKDCEDAKEVIEHLCRKLNLNPKKFAERFDGIYRST